MKLFETVWTRVRSPPPPHPQRKEGKATLVDIAIFVHLKNDRSSKAERRTLDSQDRLIEIPTDRGRKQHFGAGCAIGTKESVAFKETIAGCR